MPEFDVHFMLSGFMTITAENEDDAREVGTQILHQRAQFIEKTLYLNVVDPDEETYVTDVVRV